MEFLKIEDAFQTAPDLCDEPGSTVTPEDQKRFSDALEEAKRWNGSSSERWGEPVCQL